VSQNGLLRTLTSLSDKPKTDFKTDTFVKGSGDSSFVVAFKNMMQKQLKYNHYPEPDKRFIANLISQFKQFSSIRIGFGFDWVERLKRLSAFSCVTPSLDTTRIYINNISINSAEFYCKEFFHYFYMLASRLNQETICSGKSCKFYNKCQGVKLIELFLDSERSNSNDGMRELYMYLWNSVEPKQTGLKILTRKYMLVNGRRRSVYMFDINKSGRFVQCIILNGEIISTRNLKKIPTI
jgi:hypothetical protein